MTTDEGTPIDSVSPQAMTNVTCLPGSPARVTTEMQIRWLMANMDRVKTLALMVQIEGQNPVVSISTGCSSYYLSLASSIMEGEALRRLVVKTKGPQ
jgi:hypothetical protein